MTDDGFYVNPTAFRAQTGNRCTLWCLYKHSFSFSLSSFWKPALMRHCHVIEHCTTSPFWKPPDILTLTIPPQSSLSPSFLFHELLFLSKPPEQLTVAKRFYRRMLCLARRKTGGFSTIQLTHSSRPGKKMECISSGALCQVHFMECTFSSRPA